MDAKIRDKILDAMYFQCRSILSKQAADDAMCPVGAPFDGDGEAICVLPLPWADNRQKEYMLRAFGEFMREMLSLRVGKIPVYYVIACEAWLSPADPNEFEKVMAGERASVMPREHPQRQEALQLYLENAQGEAAGRAYILGRSKKSGRYDTFTPSAFNNSDDAAMANPTGLMTGLLVSRAKTN